MTDKLWEGLRPLYLQLHAYVRRKLRNEYGDDVMGDDGTIPIHLLGMTFTKLICILVFVYVPFLHGTL